MAQEIRHVNISELREVPAWRHLVEEVRVTKKPAIIRADGEDIAEVRPLERTAGRRRVHRPSPAEDAVFWSAAGFWKGLVDADQLKSDLKAARGSDRSPVTI